MRKDHRCYDYTINCTFHSKKPWKWQDLVFHWCLYNKQNITWPLRDMKFLFSCWKIFNMLAALTHEIFFSSQRETSYPRAAMYMYLISAIHARVQPQSFHLNSHTIGFNPQIQKLKWEFILLRVRWVSLGVRVVMQSFTVKINLNYQGKWLFV